MLALRMAVRLRPFAIAAVGLLAAALWGALLVPPHLSGQRSMLDPVEATLTDWRMRLGGVRAPAGDVVVVAIDDATLDAVSGAFPLPRAALIQLINAAADAGAKAIALDILLLSEGGPEDDRALANALARVPTVIAAAATFQRKGGAGRDTLLWPAEPFAAVARVGMVNLATEPTGTPRHVPLVLATAQGPQPHLVSQAVSLFSGTPSIVGVGAVEAAGRRHPLDINMHLPMVIYGPRGTIPSISAETLLAGEGGGVLAEKLAVIGVTATAAGDTLATPFDPVTPGVELLAGAMQQLIGPRQFVRDSGVRRIDAAVVAAVTVAGVLLVALLPLSFGLPLAFGALVLWVAASTALFFGGIWFAAALPLAAVIPPLLLTAGLRHGHERALARQSAQAANALAQFQSPALAERIAKDPSFLAKPRTQVMTVLFVDLAGFTGISEAVGLSATRTLVKDFHALVAQTVERHAGVVINYMGDGALAAFGLPEPADDDADRAFAAARSLLADVATMRFAAAPELVPAARIGLHTGAVVASRLGDERHQQISITSDAVNVAARLMDVAKANGANLACSADTVGMLGAEPVPPPDRTQLAEVRGRAASVSVALWTMPATPQP